MAKRAQVEFGFGGIQGGIKDLGDLRNALLGVQDAGKRLDATYKGLKNLWEDPAKAKGGWSNAMRTSAAITKMTAEIVGSQAGAAGKAIIAPGLTTYDQALGKFKLYREGVQRMATATGESFGSVDKQIRETSQRLGILPQQVQAYGMTLRNQTGGTMAEALETMDAAREQSLKTGQNVNDLLGPIAKLRQNFGIKGSQEVNEFFASVDNGAKGARISAEVARAAWEASSGTLQRISSMGPKAQAAFTNQIVGNSVASGQSPEMGVEHAAGLAGFFENKSYLLDRLAHKKGLLKKGEHLLGDDGRITAKGFGIAAQLSQGAMSSFYGTKDPVLAGMRAQLSGEMSASDYAQLRKFDVGKYKTDAGKFNMFPGATATKNWVESDAGKREGFEAKKEGADLDLGKLLIGLQDLAVAVGGGKAGIAMGIAADNFSQAAGIFGGAVDRFIGGLGRVPGAAGAGGSTAAGAATGTAAPGAIRAGLTAAGVGTVSLVAAAVLLPGDAIPGSQGEDANRAHRKKEIAGAKARLAAMQVPAHGFVDWISKPWGSVEGQKQHVAELEKQSADYDKQAQANAKAMANQVQRVQVITPPAAPPGQPVSDG